MSPLTFSQTNITFNDAQGQEIQGPIVPGPITVDLAVFTATMAQYVEIESADPFAAAFSGMVPPGVMAVTRILIEGTVTAAAASTGIILTTTVPEQVFRTRLMAA